jgi:hypothetical protein
LVVSQLVIAIKLKDMERELYIDVLCIDLDKLCAGITPLGGDMTENREANYF